MENFNLKKSTFFFSIVTFIYFVFLVVYSKKMIKINFINMLGELFTIPFLIILTLATISSIYGVIQEKINSKSLFTYLLIICFINITFLYCND